MFHQGDLQSGIALAIQQSKSVACFVRDDGPESSTWETEWLHQEQVSQLLSTKAVVLRLQAGSQEAGFLGAFAPIDKIPTLVVIHNGQLRETLTSGVSQEDFNSRLHTALGEQKIEHPAPRANISPPNLEPIGATSSSPPRIPTQAPVPIVSSQPAASVPVPAPAAPLQPPQVSSPAAQSPSQPPTASSPAATAQTLRKERDLSNNAKGKQRAESEPETPAPAVSTSRGDWLAQQRHRQIEAKAEKTRILAQIEADKAERKARQAEEKRLREEHSKQAEPQTNTQNASSRSSRPSNAKTANLQVRLLDGGTIRSQFSAEATLAQDIRPWIDANLESKAPYTFKHILPPQPARAISVSEENSTLRDLDLLPSATLVLQPISNYTEAYSGGQDGLLALPFNAALGAYGLVTGGIGAVTGTLGGAARWLRGGTFAEPVEQTIENHDAAGQVLGQQSEEPASQQQNQPPQGSARIRTLADQRAERGDQQFYNGNSLDFQPDGGDEDKRR